MRNYLSEMLYALTSAYSRKDYDNHQQGLPLETNIGKLFSIFAWGMDIVHENAELVKQWDDLEQAKGTVLDRYGANWGVQRFSENDALYRLAIRVKILSQLSGGDTDTVIKAAAELLGVEDPDIEFEDVFPAKIALYVDWLLLTQERQDLIEPIAWAIKRIVATGVGMRLYVRTYRTYRYDLDINHGGLAGSFFTVLPVSQNRNGTDVWNINFGGFAQSSFEPPIIGKDRSGRNEVTVHLGGYGHTDFTPPLMSEDRASHTPILTAHGTAQTQSISTTPPDVRRAHRGPQDGTGGVFFRTHIKSKRID